MAVRIMCDLRAKLGPARDQGSRPTCVAFAFSDAHLAARVEADPLSVEHLYFNAVQRTTDRDPALGVSIPDCMAALETDGQCREAGWSYKDPLDRTQWRPPSSAKPSYRFISILGGPGLATVISELDLGRPPVVSLLLGKRFYRPDREASIVLGPDDADTDYHAVVAVGHGVGASEAFVLVRNSWGESWGDAGHAWVAASYLEPRMHALTRFPHQESIR